LATKDWSSLGGLEWNRSLDSALRTGGPGLGTGDSCGCWACSDGSSSSSGALGLARLAALGVVFELLIEEKELFAGGKDELSATICTS